MTEHSPHRLIFCKWVVPGIILVTHNCSILQYARSALKAAKAKGTMQIELRKVERRTC